MSKKWLFVLLLISLSFNLAVLGSFIYIRFYLPCPSPPPMHRGQMLGDKPHEPFFMHKDEEFHRLKKDFNATKVSLMKELAKDPVDEARIAGIIDSSLVAQNKLERRLGEKILAFRKTLSAEEAREHFERRAENMHNRSPRMLKMKYRRKP